MEVVHRKCLAETQFDAMKGSPQHAAMTMNRVLVCVRLAQCKTRNDLVLATKERVKLFESVTEHLAKVCHNYYFVGRISDRDDNLRVYFLSKSEMEDFIIWSKMALKDIAVAA